MGRSFFFPGRLNYYGNSRHLIGQAVDIIVGEINKDGKYTDEDKQIVLDILDFRSAAEHQVLNIWHLKPSYIL